MKLLLKEIPSSAFKVTLNFQKVKVALNLDENS